MVTHRLPHCSATTAVVPDPHVGSKPGPRIGRHKRQRSLSWVGLNHIDSLMPPESFQIFAMGDRKIVKEYFEARYLPCATDPL